MNILTLAAIVIFCIAAILAFFFETVTLLVILGLIAAGLACFAASGLVAWRLP